MSVSNNFASNLNSKALTLNDSNFNNTNVTNYFKKGLVTDPAKCLSQNQMKTVGLKNMGEKTLRECYNLAQSNRTNLMGYSKQTVSKKNYVNGQYNNAGNRCGGPPNFNLPYYSKYEYDNNCNELEDNFIVNGINLGEEWKRDLRYGQDYKTGITKMTDMNKKCGSTTYLSGRLKGQSVTMPDGNPGITVNFTGRSNNTIIDFKNNYNQKCKFVKRQFFPQNVKLKGWFADYRYGQNPNTQGVTPSKPGCCNTHFNTGNKLGERVTLDNKGACNVNFDGYNTFDIVNWNYNNPPCYSFGKKKPGGYCTNSNQCNNGWCYNSTCLQSCRQNYTSRNSQGLCYCNDSDQKCLSGSTCINGVCKPNIQEGFSNNRECTIPCNNGNNCQNCKPGLCPGKKQYEETCGGSFPSEQYGQCYIGNGDINDLPDNPNNCNNGIIVGDIETKTFNDFKTLLGNPNGQDLTSCKDIMFNKDRKDLIIYKGDYWGVEEPKIFKGKPQFSKFSKTPGKLIANIGEENAHFEALKNNSPFFGVLPNGNVYLSDNLNNLTRYGLYNPFPSIKDNNQVKSIKMKVYAINQTVVNLCADYMRKIDNMNKSIVANKIGKAQQREIMNNFIKSNNELEILRDEITEDFTQPIPQYAIDKKEEQLKDVQDNLNSIVQNLTLEYNKLAKIDNQQRSILEKKMDVLNVQSGKASLQLDELQKIQTEMASKNRIIDIHNKQYKRANILVKGLLGFSVVIFITIISFIMWRSNGINATGFWTIFIVSLIGFLIYIFIVLRSSGMREPTLPKFDNYYKYKNAMVKDAEKQLGKLGNYLNEYVNENCECPINKKDANTEPTEVKGTSNYKGGISYLFKNDGFYYYDGTAPPKRIMPFSVDKNSLMQLVQMMSMFDLINDIQSKNLVKQIRTMPDAIDETNPIHINIDSEKMPPNLTDNHKLPLPSAIQHLTPIMNICIEYDGSTMEIREFLNRIYTYLFDEGISAVEMKELEIKYNTIKTGNRLNNARTMFAFIVSGSKFKERYGNPYNYIKEKIENARD